MQNHQKYNRKRAVHIVSQEHPAFDRSIESDQARNGGFRPAEFAGQHLYGLNELVAIERQQTLIAEGFTVRHAGEKASQLYRAMTAHPDADRIALVTLTNGNRFALPADNIDLTSGYSSGAPVREAVIVDVRNLRSRIADMIDAARQIVGVFDEE